MQDRKVESIATPMKTLLAQIDEKITADNLTGALNQIADVLTTLATGDYSEQEYKRFYESLTQKTNVIETKATVSARKLYENSLTNVAPNPPTAKKGLGFW